MPLLIETLNSLAKQTDMPDEIILSDNFSKDETQNTLKEFASSFKNTKYVRSSRYLEFGPSFNFAISHSNCDWVFFLHSDDVLSKHAIKIIRREIERAKIFTGVISFKAEIISEKSNLKRAAFSIGRRRYEFGNQFILKNLSTSSVNFGAVAINREIFYEIGKFDSENSYWLDLKYFHKLVTKYKILRVPISVVRYRKYNYERTADERIAIALNNDDYWNTRYLPKLFTENLDLDIDANKNNLNTKFKLGNFVRKCIILVMEALLNNQLLNKAAVVLRTGMDKIGIGNFGR